MLDKIIAHIKSDEELALHWQRMNNKVPFQNDPNNFDHHIFCKNRVVDPLFMDEGNIKRVSDVDEEWKITIETMPKAKEYFLKFAR